MQDYKFEIITYKGQTIWYNEDTDKFECAIEFNNNVKSVKRQSLKDVKNSINEFAKLNSEFKPFKFLTTDYSGVSEYECSAVRSDKTFVTSSIGSRYKDYRKLDYFTKDKFEYDIDIVDKITNLQKEKRKVVKEFDNKVAELIKELKPLNVDILKDYLI